MSKTKSNALLVLAAIVVFSAVLAGAAWWGKRGVSATAKLPTHEVEDLAHEADDHAPRHPAPDIHQDHHSEPPAPKHNAPKLEEEFTDWSAVVQTLQRARQVSQSVPPRQLRAELDAMGPAMGGPERVALETALGYALLAAAQPALPEAGRAFCNALDFTLDPDERVPMALDFGKALLERQGEVETLDVTAGGRFIGAKLTPQRLQIEAIRGIAYDALGLSMRAAQTYHEAFETILDTDLYDSPLGRDIARVLALRLAREYRDAGDASTAMAVSTRLRTWLGEEELLLR